MLVGAGGEIDGTHTTDTDLALDGVWANGGGEGFFLIAGGLFEDLGDGGDGGVGEEIGRGRIGCEELTDFMLQRAVGTAGFIEKGVALVGGLVEDQLEEALYLTVTFWCHAKDR